MTTTPNASPGPFVPKREPALGAGVNNDVVEMRSRLMDLILRSEIREEGLILTLMDRMELGPDFDKEDES